MGSCANGGGTASNGREKRALPIGENQVDHAHHLQFASGIHVATQLHQRWENRVRAHRRGKARFRDMSLDDSAKGLLSRRLSGAGGLPSHRVVGFGDGARYEQRRYQQQASACASSSHATAREQGPGQRDFCATAPSKANASRDLESRSSPLAPRSVHGGTGRKAPGRFHERRVCESRKRAATLAAQLQGARACSPYCSSF